jgi:TolB-like protein/DNA-binding winged helix-turn-helix (wHTH) protein/Tfp pilus assembly protein PilF
MAMAQAYEFGRYRLDVPARRLLRDGEPVPLTPKAFDTLLALIERRDRVVEKAELMRLIWPDSFVEEANLSQTVFVLRKTLGADENGRPFIDTVPRRGYRFAADVRTDAAFIPEQTRVVVPQAPAAQADIDAPRAGLPDRHLHRSWQFPVARGMSAVVIGLAIAALAWFGISRLRSLNRDPSGIESLVVLPMDNLSGDPEQDYLADGMTDALITRLAQIGGLRVISRTSAMSYKNTRKTLPEIARELNVDAVVEGAVQRSGDRLRLNLKLVQAAAEQPLWAESYDRSLHDVTSLQNEMARDIASRIQVTLTARERMRFASAAPVNPKAYEAYLKGRYFWNRRSKPDMVKAIEQFEEALRHEPNYAPAWAGLADSYTLIGAYGWSVPADKEWARAIAAADKALQLDDLLADAHTSRAGIAMNYEFDWKRAERSYRRALELNPGYANAHHWYGYYLLLMGRLPEAEAEMRRAFELDPLSPIINANIGFCYFVARRYDDAIAHWRNVLEMHRNYRLLHGYMASAYIAKEMYVEGVAEIQKGLGLSGAGPSEMAILAHTYARMGRTEDARALLSKLVRDGTVPAYYMSLAYVGLGDHDRAFEWLEKAYREHSGPINELNADPMFDPLRADPRFTALLRRMGLPTSGAHLSNRLPLDRARSRRSGERETVALRSVLRPAIRPASHTGPSSAEPARVLPPRDLPSLLVSCAWSEEDWQSSNTHVTWSTR